MHKKRKPETADFETLEKMNTKQLLGYLKKLHQCEESFEMSDLDENPDLTNGSIIYFKNTDKWKTAYNHVKLILKDRENID